MKYNLEHPKRLFGNVYWWWSLLPGVDYGTIRSYKSKRGRVKTWDKRTSFRRVVPCIYKKVEPPGVWINY
jgi:hypothetical protein